VELPHLGVGAVLSDLECYHLFKELYDPIIEQWHGYTKDQMTKTDMDASHLKPFSHSVDVVNK